MPIHAIPTLPALWRAFVPALGPSPLCYILGYAAGVGAFAWLAKRRGISTPGVGSVAIVGLIGGLVGANIAQFLASHGRELGKTVLGGIIGGYLAVHLYKRRIRMTRPLGDLFAFGLSAGEAIGRWGCYFGGCCYGRAVTSPTWWTVHQHGADRYPTQIYLSLAATAIFALLLFLEKRRALPENGLFYLQGFLACAARLVVEHYRTAAPVALGLTIAQWACVAGILFFGTMLYRLLGVAPIIPPAPSHLPPQSEAA